MRMTKDGTIRSEWGGWCNSDKCPLCGREGKDIANIWRKGHRRDSGIILETGLSYCEECVNKPECETHWQAWWDEQWRECEASAEENWQKYGVYTNVGGGPVSFHFGHAKTPDGLKPYLSVYPDCPRHKFQQEVSKIEHQYEVLGYEECIRRIDELAKKTDIDQVFKDMVVADAQDLLNRLKENYPA